MIRDPLNSNMKYTLHNIPVNNGITDHEICLCRGWTTKKLGDSDIPIAYVNLVLKYTTLDMREYEDGLRRKIIFQLLKFLFNLSSKKNAK